MKIEKYNKKQLQSLIKCIHAHMGALFNFADIKSTLVENNPDMITAEQFLKNDF